VYRVDCRTGKPAGLWNWPESGQVIPPGLKFRFFFHSGQNGPENLIPDRNFQNSDRKVQLSCWPQSPWSQHMHQQRNDRKVTIICMTSLFYLDWSVFGKRVCNCYWSTCEKGDVVVAAYFVIVIKNKWSMMHILSRSTHTIGIQPKEQLIIYTLAHQQFNTNEWKIILHVCIVHTKIDT